MDNLMSLILLLGRNINKDITIRRLSIEAEVPYTTTYRLIKENPEKFLIRKIGNLKLVSLNKIDNIIKHYLIIAERQSTEKFLKRDDKLKEARFLFPKSDDYSVIVLSYDKKRDDKTKKKQKDKREKKTKFLIINKSGKEEFCLKKGSKEIIKEAITYINEDELINLLNDVSSKGGNKEENREDNKKESKGDNKEEDKQIKNIFSNYLVLYGEEYFWNLVWKNNILDNKRREQDDY